MAKDRELIEPNPGDKRYVRRDEDGQFKESDDVSRSLSQDQKRDAQNESEPGQGDRGDRKSTGTGMGAGEASGERGGAPFDLGRTNEPEGEEPPPAA